MQLKIIGCAGAYPHSGMPTSSYILNVNNKNYLIDIGSGSFIELERQNLLDTIDTVFISHYHYDHFADLCMLEHYNLINQRKIKLYSPEPNDLARLDYNVFDLDVIHQNRKIKLKNLEIDFLKVKHPVETFAMKFTHRKKVFVYTSDTAYFDDLIEFIGNCDLLLIECSGYQDEDVSKFSHLNAEEVKRIVNLSCAKKTVLTHLPFKGDYHALLDSFKGYNNIYLAGINDEYLI